MKRLIFPFILSAICIAFSSCEKDKNDDPPIIMAPSWHYTPNTNHTASMTIIATLPETNGLSITSGDSMAAFIEGECRGVAVQIGTAFYIMVKGESSESSLVTIKFYSVTNKQIYEATDCFTFEPDATHGTADNPILIPLKF